MANSEVRALYDDLAGEYDLIHQDWDLSVSRQGAALESLIGERLGAGPHAILDCTCGIGTQALGLAARGHAVHATDLSPNAVARAEKEASSRGLEISFGVADVARLDTDVDGSFDAVLSCDNAVAHMLTQKDLDGALAGMASKIRPGGVLLVSLRDYDALVDDRPELPGLSAGESPTGRRVSFQLWDWHDDEATYRATIFLLRREESGWVAHTHEAELRAVLRRDLEESVISAGLGDCRWHPPSEGGFYQPVLTARKPI